MIVHAFMLATWQIFHWNMQKNSTQCSQSLEQWNSCKGNNAVILRLVLSCPAKCVETGPSKQHFLQKPARPNDLIASEQGLSSLSCCSAWLCAANVTEAERRTEVKVSTERRECYRKDSSRYIPIHCQLRITVSPRDETRCTSAMYLSHVYIRYQ